jgi:hypothetical protein
MDRSRRINFSEIGKGCHVSDSSVGKHWANAKALAFALLVVLFTIAITGRYDRPLLDRQSQMWSYYRPVEWWLFPHVLTALTAFTVGPLQFSNRLRRANPTRHRILGRVYATSILISGLLAMKMVMMHGSRLGRFGVFVQAGAWISTTLVAVVAARNKHFELHRLWAVRSYAICTIFVVTRLPSPIQDMTNGPFWFTNEFMVLLAFVVPELVMRRREIFHVRKSSTLSLFPE